MKLQLFNGGLNTRQAPYLLQVSEGVEYSNIDNESSSLKPVKQKAAGGTTLDQWAYYFEALAVWESSTVQRFYLEYQANLYYSQAAAVPKYFDGTTHYLLGIVGPANEPTVAVNATGAQTGTYTYVYTYYNNTKGVESQPSDVSAEVTVAAQGVDVTNMPASLDTQVTHKRIYRVGGTLTRFSLVATITNATTAYLDSLGDTAIVGSALTTTDNAQCPSGMNFLTEAYGIMFGALGDKLYFTKTGEFTSWPETYFIDFAVAITSIAITSVGLVVFTKYKAEIITGSSSANFTKKPLSGDQGCLTHASLKYVKGTILWVSSDGICTLSGSQVKVLSKDKLGAVALDIKASAFHNETYYAIKADNSILAYDFRFGVLLKELDLGVTNLVVAEDILYGYSATAYFELFAGASEETFTFKSAEFSEGSLTLRKVYKSVLLNSSGAITIEAFIDGVSVSSKSYTTADTHELKLPEDSKNGYKIQFKISGTGEVYELDYTVGAFEK